MMQNTRLGEEKDNGYTYQSMKEMAKCCDTWRNSAALG